ncbi:hypothetical protein OPKNFCMD_1889 [Methylobacterium crusticola]|uniref:Uncharacterized protein n=1 Tax=Methylobacterium crusticola TaxID=1697972 RepID=A0ABQ4QWW7_9HYPH|nr:hypothetical protein [Methylobacterium crusticola]GJD49159.1 hypothetical protein OPKNFCMD_1889 [Methylobacterium crusticola]
MMRFAPGPHAGMDALPVTGALDEAGLTGGLRATRHLVAGSTGPALRARRSGARPGTGRAPAGPPCGLTGTQTPLVRGRLDGDAALAR